MPLLMCNKLDLGEMRPTTMSLNLADRYVKYPMGLEDVPIKVGDLYVLIDFVIFEMKEDMNTPMILWRPLLDRLVLYWYEEW